MNYRMVPVADATAPQMIDFMTDEGSDDFGRTRGELEVMAKAEGKRSLGAILHEAGYQKIPVFNRPTPLEADRELSEKVAALTDPHNRFHTPEEWRWFNVRFHVERDVDGRPTQQTVPLSINSREIHVARGRNVWLCEAYVNLADSCTETHYTQEDPESPIAAAFTGAGIMPLEPEVRLRYPYSLLRIAGRVKDGPPPATGDDIIYGGIGVVSEHENFELMKRNGVGIRLVDGVPHVGRIAA